MDQLEIVKSGLPSQADNPKKIIVIGAGMAGLTAAYELKRAGHDVTILEAQNRVGGRIQTIREPFADGAFGEVGAMRIPSVHKLTMSYIEKFGLKTTAFHTSIETNFFYLNGKRHMLPDVNQDPSSLGLHLMTANGQSAFEVWSQFITETIQKMQADPIGYCEELEQKYGDWSAYDFFKHLFGSADVAIDFLMLSGFEPVMHAACTFLLRFVIDFEGSDLCQIVGGMDSLPKSFLPYLESKIQFGAELKALDYTDDSVTVHYQDAAGDQTMTGDFAIITIPFAALRFVDVITPFSNGKQTAIRELRYTEIVKILLEFKRRFWEEDDNISGGNTTTDLPNRQIYYPERSHAGQGGVLIGMYSFGAEAARWESFAESERVVQCLKYVTKIHPQAEHEFKRGVSKVWGQDRFGAGLCVYYPDEHGRFFKHTQTPEGAVHFAGEHTSYKHAWIEGAVESGLRATYEINERIASNGA